MKYYYFQGVFPSRQTTLHDTPEETESQHPPISILRAGNINQSQSKFLEHSDVQLVIALIL